jgi:hypothetical protein
MGPNQLAIARLGTALALFAVTIAFLLGGYSTRFDWSDGRWVATVLEGTLLAIILFRVIRSFWWPKAGWRFW